MNKLIYILTTVFLLVNTLVLGLIFFNAFTHNGETLVQINYYGEGLLEVILFSLLFLLLCYRIYLEVLDARKYKDMVKEFNLRTG